MIVVDHYLLWQQGPGAQITRVALLGEKCRKIRRPETMTSTEGAGYSRLRISLPGRALALPDPVTVPGRILSLTALVLLRVAQAPDLSSAQRLTASRGNVAHVGPSKGFGHAPGLLQQVRGSFIDLTGQAYGARP